jgi:hypothetical protein
VEAADNVAAFSGAVKQCTEIDLRRQTLGGSATSVRTKVDSRGLRHLHGTSSEEREISD